MKVLALSGILGYGYSEAALKNAFLDPPDYIGVDGGSTDPGPYYLGKGVSFTDRNAVKRDIAQILPQALRLGAPFIVGTGGGSGSCVHLNWLRDIVLEISKEENLSFKMALIYTDVDASYVLEKYQEGKLKAMGGIEVNEDSIQQAVRIVSQVGVSAIIDALKNGADVILAGRCCDTAIYAAPCLLNGYDPGLAYHMAKVMECGAMCASPVSAADMMLGTIEKDYFELTPVNPSRRCTVRNVAAHTMYEQGSPYLIYEPDGVVNLSQSQYKQVSERTVRVSNSLFFPSEKSTIKLEGVKLNGFRTIAVAGINDPLTIKEIDLIFEGVCAFVSETLEGRIDPNSYQLMLHKYGEHFMFDPSQMKYENSNSMGVIIEAIGETQEISKTVLALARSRMLHFDYPGRKSTAGNLAFPYSPSDFVLGEVYTFCVYHLAEVDSLSETAQITYLTVGERQ